MMIMAPIGFTAMLRLTKGIKKSIKRWQIYGETLHQLIGSHPTHDDLAIREFGHEIMPVIIIILHHVVKGSPLYIVPE
jgi:hypothetical protein